jgi:hypothetical protein
MTTDNFCIYLQNRLIQTSQTGGQWYNDTSPFSIPWMQVAKNNSHCALLYSPTNIRLGRKRLTLANALA